MDVIDITKESAGTRHIESPLENNKKVSVAFFHRKRDSSWNYSIEFIFSDVRERLKYYIDARVIYSRYYSVGLFKRAYNCLQAFFNQGDVNHVTGDIHYIGFFLNRGKTIHTIHDCVFLKESTGMRHKVLKYFWLMVPVRRSRFITTVSEASKAEITRYSRCPPEKVVVIPNAISELYVKSQKAFNKEQPLILIVGTAPNKNIPRFIEALTGLHCRIEIIGRYNAAYEALLKEAGLTYTLRRGLSDEEMVAAYRNCDLLLFASTYEGFGMPIVEAQATGRAVVTSNIQPMADVAGDGACLVDPHDAGSIRRGVQQVIDDDAYRNGLIEKGFGNAKRYNPELIARQYLTLYKAIEHS